MNTKTILLAAAGIGAGLLLARGAVQGGLARGLIRTGDAQRAAGIDHLYRLSASQQAALEAAQSSNRATLASELTQAGQPDFWA